MLLELHVLVTCFWNSTGTVLPLGNVLLEQKHVTNPCFCSSSTYYEKEYISRIFYTPEAPVSNVLLFQKHVTKTCYTQAKQMAVARH